MGRQEAVFLKGGEGNGWFQRNRTKLAQDIAHDPVLVATWDLRQESVIEIGCSNGWRLEQYRISGAACYGVDPSIDAIQNGKELFPGLNIRCATATTHDVLSTHDLVIYGFCLYLCDREDLPEIVFSGDVVTKDGGHLVIHDFDPDYPHKVPYRHVAGLYSYKMDYSKLWLSNPAYSLVHKEVIGDGTAVWVLKKDMAAGWPEEIAP